MSTPNSAGPRFDLNTDPVTNDVFSTNLEEKTVEQVEFANDPNTSQRSSCNVGRAEQKIRLSAGTALLAVAAFAPLSRGWRIALATFGVSQLATGAMSYCPLWHALGVNTRREEE